MGTLEVLYLQNGYDLILCNGAMQLKLFSETVIVLHRKSNT